MKLGIIVPYRDRESHLTKFRDGINAYFKDKKIKYELIKQINNTIKILNDVST